MGGNEMNSGPIGRALLALVVLASTIGVGAASAGAQQGRSPEDRRPVYVELTQPLDAEERDRPGLSVEDVAGPTTYLVTGTSAELQRLSRHPDFVAFSDIKPADRLSPAMRRGTPPPWAREADGTVAVDIEFYSHVPLSEAQRELRRVGGRTTTEGYLLAQRLQATVPPPAIERLASSELVAHVREQTPDPHTHNAQAATLSKVDIARTVHGLDGTGVKVGIWDGGPVMGSHQELTGRVVAKETTQPVNDHATHVAGTIAASGVVPAARGMAPNAGPLYSYDFYGDPPTEMVASRTADGIDLSNNSWGYITGFHWNGSSWLDYGQERFGTYDGTAQVWDHIVRTTGLPVVKSSGNDGSDCPHTGPYVGSCDGVLGSDGVRYDTVSSPGTAKNVITVGAIRDNGTTVTTFSSAGPADDGRIKPDLVANGENLYSSLTHNNGTGYGWYSGTSMSTPTVSGGIALLTEKFRDVFSADPTPAQLKALLVNTAIDLGRPGPDYVYGHGLMDVAAAADSLDEGNSRLVDGSVAHGETHTETIQVPADLTELKVTLAWTDPEAPSNTGAGTALINNLDLELVSPNSEIRYPFTGPDTDYTANATATGPNSVDNVLQAVVPTPAVGTWTVQVKGTNVPLGPQGYALAMNADIALVCGSDEFAAEYFNNRTLTGAPALERCETAIDHNWGAGSPDPAINPDDFSTRWTGTITIDTTDDWTFTATADDGIRVWINNNLIIDRWHYATSTLTATIPLTAGDHHLRVEHYERVGHARATLHWAPPTCPGQLTAEYFNNRTLTGAPALERCETAIDHNWGAGSPDPAINPDDFSTRWTGTITIDTTDDWTFTATADDGIRVWINNNLIIDRWHYATSTLTATIPLTAGDHHLRVEHYERVGHARATLHWAPAEPQQ